MAESLSDERVSVFADGCDVQSTELLDAAMSGVDGVFHLAALWLLQCHEYPRYAFDVNIKGSFNVFEACVRNNIKKIVFSSSASVYGDAQTDVIEEDHPFNNKNFYGATKICGEAMLTSFHHRYGLDFEGLRYMNVYGPRQDYRGAYIAVMMKMLDAIDKGESPTIFGDGSERFDFIHVSDCARANIFAMKASATNSFYNVGTGVGTSLRELAEALLEVTGSDLTVRFKPQQNKTLVKERIGSVGKAKAKLGFEAGLRLRDGLKSLVEWRQRAIEEMKR